MNPGGSMVVDGFIREPYKASYFPVLTILISLCITVFLWLPAMGTVINVPGDYSDIQWGINAASSGDTVLVADGTYYENINYMGKAILVTSQNGPEHTTIEILTTGQPVVAFNNGEGSGSILTGFTVEGDSSYWGIYLNGTSPTIYNNIIKKHEVGIRVDNGGSPLVRKNEITLCSHSDIGPHNGGGIRMQSADGAVIDSNEIHHNYSNVAGGIFLYQCSNIIVERNLIYSNSSVYIGGLEISTSDSIHVYNNTFVDNSSNDLNLGSINCSVTNYVTVAGNISAFNNEYGICNYQSNTSLVTRYNDVYGNIPDNYYQLGPGTGSISSDPLFVDPANDDYNLTGSSPCINAGDPTLPFDPDGTLSDMGALYYPLGPLTYGALAGAVTDTFGLPVQNARVVEPYYGREDWTDTNGEYFIDSLVTWTGYDIQFSHPDFLDTTVYDVQIIENDTTELDVVMSFIPDPGAISGTVTDSSMTPIENVYVVISNTGTDTYTDSNGEYIFTDLYPDEYDLFFSHPDYVPQYFYDVSVTSNDTTDLDAILYEYGSVTGTVSDSGGSPISNVIVTDIITGYKDTTIADGAYLLSNLPPGPHNISFFHYLYGDTTVQDVMVYSDQTTVLDVTLYDFPGCDYAVGDVNFSDNFNVLDLLYGMYYFRGMVNPSSLCECTLGNSWYVQGDVDGSCSFIGLDITRMYNYLRHIWTELTPCPDCPPVGRSSSNLNYEELIVGIDFDYSPPVIKPGEFIKPDYNGITLTDEGVELWFGNLDESPVDAVPGQPVEIDVYIQMANDAYVSCFNLPLGADDDYISSFLSESQGHIYGLTDWDGAEFVPVDGSPPNPAGWSSQSLLAVNEHSPPFLDNWLHYESPTLIGTFVLQTVNDSSFANQTVYCIGPGISSRSGAAVFGDSTATIEHEVTQHFSPIHFLDPAAYASVLMGTVTDNASSPIEGVTVSIEGTSRFDVTDPNGDFMINNIIQGTYDVSFAHPFYHDTVLTDISIVANETTTVDVVMHEGISNDIALSYGTIGGTPLNAVIGSRLFIDVYIQTGSDTYIDYFNIALGLEDQYFDSLLSETEGQIHDILPQWDEVIFREPTGSPPNPAGWTAEAVTGFSDIIEPYDSPALHCLAPTKILTFVVRIPNDPSLIGDTIQCLGPGIGQYNTATEFGDTLGLPIYDFAENFAAIRFLDPVQSRGVLNGTISNVAQQPIEGAAVSVEGTGLSDVTNASGAFFIDDIVQDIYNVSFSHPDYCDTVLAGVEIVANETTTVNMTMGGIGFIDGLVTDPDQNPIDSVIVSVEGIDIIDTTDSGGTYLLESLCPGTYSVSFSHPDYVEHIESDITVTENDTAHVNVTLWPPIANDLVIWFGPPDGSPIPAIIGERLNIDVYMQTGSDIAAGFFHIALGTEDQYFDSLLSQAQGVFHDVIPQWDEAVFFAPDGSPPNPAGWSNQSALGFWDLFGAPNPPLICANPTKILTYVVRVTDDTTLAGDTVQCLGPGTNPANGQTVFGDTLDQFIPDVIQHFNSLYFISPSSLGGIAGTVTDAAQFPIEGVIVNVQEATVVDTTDGSGQFLCENIIPGIYDVSFYHPDYIPSTANDVEVIAGQTTIVDRILYEPSGDCAYVTGDVNNSGTFNGLDITFGVVFFKGGTAPFYSCECTPGNVWYVAGDVNNSCNYNGLDITYGVAYLKGGPDPMPCPDCPPAGITSLEKNRKESRE